MTLGHDPPPRVVFAGLFHETHGFLEESTGLKNFQITRGDRLLACTGDSSPLGGALESAQQFGWEIVPTCDYRAIPSGVVEDAVVEAFWKDLSDRWHSGIDAAFFVLHGAMLSESFLDVEGEILRRFRLLDGAQDIPVFGVFDLHANVSVAMTQYADALVSYRENPHSDARESAVRATALLQRHFESGIRPHTIHQFAGILWPPIGTGTGADPMKSLERAAREIERTNTSIWAVNVASGFAFADTPDTGLSFQVVTTGTSEDCAIHLDYLTDLARELNQSCDIREQSIEEAIAAIKQPNSGLTVLVEPSDNIGAGAPGDGTSCLRALVSHRVQNAAVAINDPGAVCQLRGIAVGSRSRIEVGGKGSRFDAGPLPLDVELISRGNGLFELEDKHSHLASLSGNHFDMGECAVVRHEGIRILLTSNRTPPFDLGQWRSQGIDPAKLNVIVVKAAVAHKRAYDPITARTILVDTPGPCRSDLTQLGYRYATPGW